MQLFVMRHGEAETQAAKDRDRALTKNGHQQVEKMGLWLNEKTDGAIDYALVSPYTRAQQTLECVASKLDIGGIEQCKDIIPAGRANLFVDYLSYWHLQHPQARSLLLISHMPFVSYLLDELCTQPYSKLFATASVAHLQWDPECGNARLITLQHPSQLN